MVRVFLIFYDLGLRAVLSNYKILLLPFVNKNRHCSFIYNRKTAVLYLPINLYFQRMYNSTKCSVAYDK